jgi:hypothetical protein
MQERAKEEKPEVRIMTVSLSIIIKLKVDAQMSLRYCDPDSYRGRIKHPESFI